MRSRMNARTRERLLDGLVEAYVGWRKTCDCVNDAYRRWTLETGAAAAATFALYMGRSMPNSRQPRPTRAWSCASASCRGHRSLRPNRSASQTGELTGHDP
jgi:hypothetical protein